MFKPLFTMPRAFQTRFLPIVALSGCLVLLALTYIRQPSRHPFDFVPAPAPGAAEEGGATPKNEPRALAGAQARTYLEQTGEGQSLMKALAAEQYGLKRQPRSPFKDEPGTGYLGMSHDQNLNAWFDQEGVTLGPTLSEKDREKAWQLGFRLKSYGYGGQQTPAAPIVSHQVKETRIEYARGGNATGASLVEWYENKSEGIEQGFTLPARLERGAGADADEPLRMVMEVTGDLRARAKDEGQAIELSKLSGEGVLSYSKLSAVDANGKQFAARMGTNVSGDEIALEIDDKDAVYPLVIDPVTATLEKKLDAGGNRQADARFGFAVAIDGNRAVVGAWREDVPFSALVDAGAVYTFTRTGTVWGSATLLHQGTAANATCGWSVALQGDRVVYGCPGANNQNGLAYLRVISSGSLTEIKPNPNELSVGDQFGYSVAINGIGIAVGAPFYDFFYQDSGRAHYFTVNSDGSVITPSNVVNNSIANAPNQQVGVSVALDGDYLIVGALGHIELVTLNSGGTGICCYGPLPPFDGKNNNFGESVAISGNTMVIGAWGDDDVATDAGAAYVYVRGANGIWSHQQKLTASDGRAGDQFSLHAVAIEGHTIVVGANTWDAVTSGDNAGAAYIFTRSGSVWTRQAALYGNPAENFGISVDISRDTVIVGARAADASGTSRAGAVSVYRLDCIPFFNPSVNGSLAVCQGGSLTLLAGFIWISDASNSVPTSFQWRRNGVNIPGATSSTYTINNASASDAASYDVIISSACSSQIAPPHIVTLLTFSLNPTSQNFSASGSNGSVNVTSTGSCGWTAVSNASWITITSGASGSGNGTVGFTVAANSGTSSRTGTLTIAGQTFTVTQQGTVPASNTVQFGQPAYSVGEGAGSATISVTRSGAVSAPATIEYATTDGAASDRGDYNTTIGRLRFGAGESVKTFSVLVTDDAYAEGTESFNLTLSNPTGGPSLGSPSTATLSITDNDATTSSSNPIDSTPIFVRQHYVDFFSRETDASGLAFWSNNIDSCGGNGSCREVKRIDTSAAFFLSIEFQETGYLVHRLYRASFNRLARYREFVRDSQEIGRNVVVNSPGWEAQLDANKQAFISELAARADFQALYAGMTNAQYVDALNANTAASLSQSERDALVSGLNGGSETRPTVLRKVAEDADFNAREKSPAFVLMQYFGYLRRNPDDAPEPGLNFTGYNFWLGKLNSFGGDYRAAEMVKAFLTSSEYRQRFGQP